MNVTRSSLALILLLGVGSGLAGTTGELSSPSSAAEESASAHVSISDDGTAIFVDGFIDRKTAEQVRDKLKEGVVDSLFIRSTGGEVEAGIELGEMVRDSKIDVIVKDYCISSCANYVFTAGASRVIGGVVLWHGSVEQKDVRECFLCNRRVSSLYGGDMPLATPERVSNWDALRRRQSLFFQSIGVDEYITRAGQEPVLRPGGFKSDSYTYDVATMERFGLRDVKAPDAYGTQEWCEHVNKGLPHSIGCVTVTPEMLEYERVRRELGEQCRPDGTLEIRQGSPQNLPQKSETVRP